MTVQAAYLLPSSPLPYFQGDNPPWQPLKQAMEEVGRRIAEHAPDVLIVYSTTWQAVMDQLWQAREIQRGSHVDQNWFDLGELHYDFRIDTDLAAACARAASDAGIKSKEVDYEGFPIDTGTIVAMHFINPEGAIPVVLTSNNLYHDPQAVEHLGAVAAAQADRQHKKSVVIAIGELSGSFFRDEIDIATDHIALPEQDQWNRRMLGFLEVGDAASVNANLQRFNDEGRAEYGFKHIRFLLGALGESFRCAQRLAYAPLYGKGGAVVELLP